MLRISVIASVVASLALGVPAQAENAKLQQPQDRASAFMRIFGPTLPPYGFVRFCEATPSECRAGSIEESRLGMDAVRMALLDRVNREVNTQIKPATDLELYGETERWTLPRTHGDCEDYALLKRQRLMAMGWPASSLLMTVVLDEKGEGHAILTARTAQGDYILDNKTDDLKLWHKVPYTFIMRQSYIDPRVWVSLDPRDARAPALLAGVKSRR